MKSTSITPIKKLYSALKPTIFSSQVIFFNLLFNFTKDDISELINELESNILKYCSARDYDSFMSSSSTKEFYNILLNYPDDSDSLFPSIKSNATNSESARVNISTHMNDNGASAIPLYWRKQYFEKNDRDSYKSILITLLTYYMVMYHQNRLTIHKDSITLNEASWLALTNSIRENSIPYGKINSFSSLASMIIGQIWAHCQRASQSTLLSQWDFFQTHVDCYGERNINKYHALIRYYKENVYCANMLGNIYYYGCTFYTEQFQNPVKIEMNYAQAFQFYSRCTKEPNIIHSACWSAGYMILKRLVDISGDRLAESEKMFKKCGNYAPALNSLALIEKERGDEIYLNRDYNELTDQEKKICKKHYLEFINYCYRACANDWVYSYNNLYRFFITGVYKTIRDELSSEKGYKDLDPILLLQKSAQKKNAWAMDKLACHYIAQYLWKNKISIDNFKTEEEVMQAVVDGDIHLTNDSLTDRSLIDAKNLLLSGSTEQNYNRCTFHLAINFYYERPFMGNLLAKAASQGNENAQRMLKELMDNLFD